MVEGDLFSLKELYSLGGGGGWGRGADRSWRREVDPCSGEAVSGNSTGPGMAPGRPWIGVTCTVVAGVVRVTALNIDSFYLSTPEALAALLPLTALQSITISNNKLSEMPRVLGSLPALTSITCTDNQLTSLPAWFEVFKDRLVTLNLNRNLLREVPEVLMAFTRTLGLLDLQNMFITSLPPWIESLGALKTFKVAGNMGIDGATYPRHPGLVRLDSENCSLPSVPDAIAAMTNLTILYLQDNRFSHAPDFLFQLPKIQNLQLYRSGLRTVSDKIGLANRTLTRLDLDQNNLVEIPDGLGDLVNMRTLFLHSNPTLVKVPDLSRMRIVELYFARTGIETLPRLNLQRMTRIDINDNKRFRPGQVLSLCGPVLEILNMANLNASGLNVTTAPCLPSLKTFSAAGNQLSAASYETLRDAASLTTVDLTRNVGAFDACLPVLAATPNSTIESLKFPGTGINGLITEILWLLTPFKLLKAIDLSNNPGISGSVTSQTATDAGLVNVPVPVVLPILIFRLDNTGVEVIADTFNQIVPTLRILSLSQNPKLSPTIGTRFANLENLDTRDSYGNFSGVVRWREYTVGGAVEVGEWPGTARTRDAKSNSMCPALVTGGTVNTYSVATDPEHFGYKFCVCAQNSFGEPARGCSPCPKAQLGDGDLVTIRCDGGGLLVVEKGWLVLRRRDKVGPGESFLEVLSCPACSMTTLNVSVNSKEDWSAKVRAASVNGSSVTIATACKEGYSGRLCSRCSPGFFRSGSLCLKCSGSKLSWAGPVFSVVFITGLGVRFMSKGRSSRNGLLRTLLLHSQLLSLLPEMSVRLSSFASIFFRISSSGSGGVRLDGVECSLGHAWDPVLAPFIFACMLPITVFVGSILIVAIAIRLRVADHEAINVKDLVYLAAMYLWLLSLFESMSNLMAPLNCNKYGSSEGLRYMNSAPWELCRGSKYRGVVATGVIFAAVYILGTATFLVFRLRRQVNPSASASARLADSFLRSPYQDKDWFWEGMQFLRRVLLAMIVVLAPGQGAVQPLLVSVVLTLALGLQALRKPYVRAMDNYFELASITILLITYVGGTIASNISYRKFLDTISTSLVVVNLLFLGTTLVVIIATTNSVREKITQIRQRGKSATGAQPASLEEK